MKDTIKYTAQGFDKNPYRKSARNDYEVSNAEVVIEAIELLLVLFLRVENPKRAKSLPVITKIPQLLESISEEKKLAIASISQTRNQLVDEINSRMKGLYFAHFDKYGFDRIEKEIAWLLLKAHSTKECIAVLKISVSQFRYYIKKMCKKTKTATKDKMISKLRKEVEKFLL